jgi:carbonic anhydrase
MSQILAEVLASNRSYASNFEDKNKLALPPGRRFAILTCMDARLDPANYASQADGDANVIRNTGGRAVDNATLSLVISYKLLGTREYTPTAGWSFSQMKSCMACWLPVWRPRN